MWAPSVLDVTASYRSMWSDKNDGDAVFVDQRREVHPDVIAVWAYLPFQDGVFPVVNWDPPHMIYSVEGKPSFLTEKFGLLQRETWPRDLKIAFCEIWRVTKPTGVVLFKWNDNHVSAKKVLALFPVKHKFGSIVGGSRGVRRRGSTEPRSRTWWFCFVK
jgi:hypothetical protein